jgi:hypothetical protein
MNILQIEDIVSHYISFFLQNEHGAQTPALENASQLPQVLGNNTAVLLKTHQSGMKTYLQLKKRIGNKLSLTTKLKLRI